MTGETLPGWLEAMMPPGRRDSMHDVGIDAGPGSFHAQRVAVSEWGPPDGRAVVLLHGNPTWSFLWRRVVAALLARPDAAGLRLIAPDLVGLGRSSKPPMVAHSLAHHAEWIGEVIDRVSAPPSGGAARAGGAGPFDRVSAPPSGGAARAGGAGPFDRVSAPPSGGAARPGGAGPFDRVSAPPSGGAARPGGAGPFDRVAPGPVMLVAQDWGGPIGLRAFAEPARLARLRGIVLGNTAVGPPAESFRPTLFHRLSQLPVASDLLFRGAGFPIGVLHMSQGDRGSIRGDVARAYRWPLRHLADRAAPLALARMVPDRAQGHVSIADLSVAQRTFERAPVPVALVWGTRDPILGRVVGHVARLRPDATVVRTDAGHFLQEEVPDALADAIVATAARAAW